MSLPYSPIDPIKYPPALVKLGVIYSQPLEIGQDFLITNHVTLFEENPLIKITGFRYSLALAISPESCVRTKAEEYFFSKYPRSASRQLTKEYGRLYPEECALIPGRV